MNKPTALFFLFLMAVMQADSSSGFKSSCKSVESMTNIKKAMNSTKSCPNSCQEATQTECQCIHINVTVKENKTDAEEKTCSLEYFRKGLEHLKNLSTLKNTSGLYISKLWRAVRSLHIAGCQDNLGHMTNCEHVISPATFLGLLEQVFQQFNNSD